MPRQSRQLSVSLSEAQGQDEVVLQMVRPCMKIDNKFNALSRTTGEEKVEFQYEDILCKVLSEDRPIMHPEFVVESASTCITLPTNPTDASWPSQSDARSSKLASSNGEDNSSSTPKTGKTRGKSIINSLHLLREDMKAFENMFMEMEAKRMKKEEEDEETRRKWEEEREIQRMRWEEENRRQENFLTNLVQSLHKNK